MPTMAPISRVSERRRTLIIRSVPMLPEPMTATLVLLMLGSLRWANVTDTEPSPEIWASNVSPAATGTIGPRAPERMTCPARRGSPKSRAVRASQASALSGSPRQAAPLPVETTSPSRVMLISTSTGLDLVERLRGRRPEDVERARAVVGHRVGEGDVPAGDPAVDDLERGQDLRDRGPDLRVVEVALGQVGAEHERDLGLDLGLQQPVRWRRWRRRRSPCRRGARRSPAGRRRSGPARRATSGRPCGRRRSPRRRPARRCRRAGRRTPLRHRRRSGRGRVGRGSGSAGRARAARPPCCRWSWSRAHCAAARAGRPRVRFRSPEHEFQRRASVAESISMAWCSITSSPHSVRETMRTFQRTCSSGSVMIDIPILPIDAGDGDTKRHQIREAGHLRHRAMKGSAYTRRTRRAILKPRPADAGQRRPGRISGG